MDKVPGECLGRSGLEILQTVSSSGSELALLLEASTGPHIQVLYRTQLYVSSRRVNVDDHANISATIIPKN